MLERTPTRSCCSPAMSPMSAATSLARAPTPSPAPSPRSYGSSIDAESYEAGARTPPHEGRFGSDPAVAAASQVTLWRVWFSSDTLYGAIFVKGVPQGSYPFSRPSVSLFDLKARFFAPTHTHRGAGARRSGQGWRVSATEGLSLPGR